ncbi:Oidioi.mRNA.OKI2018_I69.PAR.g8593.t1.cds [Oikopleura dioica]|uniref:Oidioi.mRNA.OKI2018_I69.PAR.g8593.t1.cds n=1 Tax=Oikopleura dioica TaxID=34765 RepID=A0ABN7RMI3_OIKDI|nr:Oidioi.mRNA.OKI2018_I69.PAR.g8593.t1.cds [Oikopleura dioica]
MGSRNSSFSDLENLAAYEQHMFMVSPNLQMTHGHSDSEMVGHDFDAKRRKVPNRARSGSCIDAFQYNKQVEMQAPWIREYPSEIDGMRVEITKQPVNHRAQYIGEGSRGPVRSTKGHPQLRVSGVIGNIVIRVYLCIEDDPVRYHPFYRVCKVLNKLNNGSQGVQAERTLDNAVIIEQSHVCTSKNELIDINSVGILKLKNSTVEAAFGATFFTPSTKVRIAFMVQLPDRSVNNIIQVLSDPICCNQISSDPVVMRSSIDKAPATGNVELWLIGKHFRHLKVFFQELGSDGKVVWKAEATVNKSFLAANHLICNVPEYCNTNIKEPVKVQVYVQTQYKEQFRTSSTVDFTYTPVRQNENIFANQTRISDPSPIHRNEPTMRLKDIGKTDSFDRMINALKFSVDQMTNSGEEESYEEGMDQMKEACLAG